MSMPREEFEAHESQLSSFAILAGVLIDGTGRPPRRDVGLLVENGVIQREQEIDSILQHARTRGVRVLDWREGSVSPGLIDAHVHLAWGDDGQSHWPIAGDSRDLLLWAASCAQSALRAGITTVRDCGAPHGITLP